MDAAVRLDRQRVAVEDDHIGQLAGFERADFLLEPQRPRTAQRRHLERLCGRKRLRVAGRDLLQLGRQVHLHTDLTGSIDDLRAGGWDTDPYLGPSEFYNNFGRFDVRIDENLSSKDTMFGRYSYSTTNNLYPGPYAGIADGAPNRPGSGTTDCNRPARSNTRICEGPPTMSATYKRPSHGMKD